MTRSRGSWLPQESHIYSHTVNVIPIISIPCFAHNKEYGIESIPYSIFDRIYSIPYLTRIRNKEWNTLSIPYSLSFFDPTVSIPYLPK